MRRLHDFELEPEVRDWQDSLSDSDFNRVDEVRGRRSCANATTEARGRDLRKAGVMTGYHTRWVRPQDQAEDPERIAIREALAFGKAVYDQRRALGLSVADLAGRAGMSVDEVECIEEGGTEPTIALLRRLAAALDADVHLTAGTISAPSGSNPTQPDLISQAVPSQGRSPSHRDMPSEQTVQYPP
jgi:transcriptional regulator with XRE-family HTH domain